MEGLQRPLEEVSRTGIQKTPPTSVSTRGLFGPGNFIISSASPAYLVEVLARPLPQVFSNLRVEDQPTSVGYRTRELEWRRRNTSVLKAFANEWIVLEGEQIVAHGPNPVEVINEARAKGIGTPYIFFVEPADENVVRIGL